MDAALDQLMSEAMVESLPPAPLAAVLPRQAIAKVSYSHEAMIDAILSNPGIAQGDLARIFGYSQGWISQVLQSDAFQAKMHARVAELRDPLILASIELQFKGILASSMELMRARLEKPDVPDQFILRSVELSSRALGYGANREPARPPEDVNEKLVGLADRLVGLLHQHKNTPQTFDAEQ